MGIVHRFGFGCGDFCRLADRRVIEYHIVQAALSFGRSKWNRRHTPQTDADFSRSSWLSLMRDQNDSHASNCKVLGTDRMLQVNGRCSLRQSRNLDAAQQFIGSDGSLEVTAKELRQWHLSSTRSIAELYN